MGLRNGIIVDASADIPQSLRAHPQLRILPVLIQLKDELIKDKRDAAQAREFNRTHLNITNADYAKSVPYSEADISDFFMRQVACDFDHAFGIFVTGTRSPIYKNAFAASTRVIQDSVSVRNDAGIKGPLYVECYDSGSMFSGFGALVMEMLRTLSINGSQTGIRARLEEVTKRTYCYAVPDDIDFVMRRARAKGEDSVTKLEASIGKLFNQRRIVRAHRGQTESVGRATGFENACGHVLGLALAQLERGLAAPVMSISFAGDIKEVESWSSFGTLKRRAQELGVELGLCEMSPANSVNIGARAFSVGFIADSHEADFS
jgi:fatty acid-binding protein DegV